MIKKLISISILAFVSLSAHAEIDAVDQLKQAFVQQQNTNSFAGFNGTCLGAQLYTKVGPVVVAGARQCFSYFVGKSFVNDFVAANRLVFVYRNTYMDLVQIPNGTIVTAPKGNFYYLVNYDDSGNASEVTVINDALP